MDLILQDIKENKLCASGISKFSGDRKLLFLSVVPITKLFARGVGGNGGHVL